MRFSLLTTVAALGLVTAAPAAEIEFWYGNTGRIEEAIQAECKAFNESQSEHVVKCVGQGNYETSMQKAIAAYRAGQAPALIQFFDGGTLDLMLSGAIEPVQQVWPEVNWGDYLAGARGYYESSKGELYAQPYNGSTLIFFGNMEELGKVGVTKLPETFEEIEDAARKLKDSGFACPLVTDGHPWRILEQFAAIHGVPIATEHNGYGGLDTELIYNQGLIADHMKRLAEWHKDGLLRLNAETKAGNHEAAFAAGECAMIIQGTGFYAAAHTALGDNLAIGLPPIYAGHERHNSIIGGAAIYVMKGHDADQLAGAKAFLDYIRQPGPQIEFARATGYLPMTNETLAELEKQGLADTPEFATARLGVESLNMPGTEDTRGIRLGFFTPIRDAFIEETTKAFNGEQDMQAALDKAVARGNEQLRRFEQTYQGVELP
ncbi:extracellular solute-binding protein [Mesorhizobium sp. L-8-3]|uniref:extracellular solute-binding protein n=1 Tax=Mesorhizobium sp. L-8-3 TaxID=2744522 RepID=UPI00406D0869